MKENKKAALYIRVSTDAQREEGYSLEAQKEMLEAYCKSKGIKKYDFYLDGGYTGSNIDRPEMQRLINDVKEDKISSVIVYKLDRLSRSQKDALYLIEDVFNPHGVDFISMNENMDTSTPMGRLMLGILAAFAQLERENIKERTRMGMKERVKSGLWMGGGRIPFGYDYDKAQGILVANKDADTVKKIYELYLQGYAPQKIAAICGLKYDKLVTQILMRKSNIGVITYNDEEYTGRHEPIISLETYQQAMDMMKERSVRKTVTSDYLLTGLVYCGSCGAKMRYQKWGKSGVKLSCYSQQTSKPYLIKDPDCKNEKVWADDIEDAIIKDLFKIKFADDTETPQSSGAMTALDMLMKQYSVCSAKIKRLYNLYAESNNEILLETIQENQKELSSLQKQIEYEQNRNISGAKMNEIRTIVENLSEMWEYMTIAEKQRVVRACVSKVVIANNAVDVFYNFQAFVT